MTTEQAAYERGVAAGEITARLAGHDAHFASINGSLIDLTAEMKALNLQMQRMSDAMLADRERVIATAAALDQADKARRTAAADVEHASERRWSPWARVLAVAAILVHLAALGAYLYISNRA